MGASPRQATWCFGALEGAPAVSGAYAVVVRSIAAAGRAVKWRIRISLA